RGSRNHLGSCCTPACRSASSRDSSTKRTTWPLIVRCSICAKRLTRANVSGSGNRSCILSGTCAIVESPVMVSEHYLTFFSVCQPLSHVSSYQFVVERLELRRPLTSRLQCVVQVPLPRVAPQVHDVHVALLSLSLHAGNGLLIHLGLTHRRVPHRVAGLGQCDPVRHGVRHGDQPVQGLSPWFLELVEYLLALVLTHVPCDRRHFEPALAHVFSDEADGCFYRGEHDHFALRLTHDVRGLF